MLLHTPWGALLDQKMGRTWGQTPDHTKMEVRKIQFGVKMGDGDRKDRANLG